MKIQITILRPGGNDTALIAGIPQKNMRKVINDAVMRKFPSVEQVGFYEYDATKKETRLEMAGGEFCGNATRSLAYLLLDGKKGELRIWVSGTQQVLIAGVNKPNTAFSQMPIKKSFDSIKMMSPNLVRVELEGITHVITKKPDNIFGEQLKNAGREILEKEGLLSSTPAAGVMFVSKEGTVVDPIVWVRDIQTLFYETACASGTTAIGLWKSLLTDRKDFMLNVLQPSNKSISVRVEKNERVFNQAVISGQIETLNTKKGLIII